MRFGAEEWISTAGLGNSRRNSWREYETNSAQSKTKKSVLDDKLCLLKKRAGKVPVKLA
ncbi:Uncharacterised protein [Vibrio cholerae]|uniref:Uncharacterized protein n=1 Tax=Vibrio cholerae TaxID=666 RepID=A0A655QU70_VIBCL|nr:Uncharacterised protein [Vibrio cholerae]